MTFVQEKSCLRGTIYRWIGASTGAGSDNRYPYLRFPLRFKHSLPRSLTARRASFRAAFPQILSSMQKTQAGACCVRLAVSTRTPAPIVEETLTFFR